tara:strand:- start:2293 stop:3114 length:822 start_codon:yes stop_codon:yes gene_type:complete
MALSDFLIASKTADAKRDIDKYSRKAGKAIGKQSKWGNLGRMVGEKLLPAAATAALGPLGWAGSALAAGAGSYLGGKLGRAGAKATGGTITSADARKLKQSNWLKGSGQMVQDDVKDMKSMLSEQNMSAALTAGVKAGAQGIADIKEAKGKDFKSGDLFKSDVAFGRAGDKVGAALRSAGAQISSDFHKASGGRIGSAILKDAAPVGEVIKKIDPIALNPIKKLPFGGSNFEVPEGMMADLVEKDPRMIQKQSNVLGQQLILPNEIFGTSGTG